jgi:hypothetical protein
VVLPETLRTDGMSAEPKKKSRAWTWWIAVLALMLLYPLSMGPWFGQRSMHKREESARFATVYAPIVWTATKSRAIERAINSYLFLWKPNQPPGGH